mgnify:FL=1
MRNRFDRQLEKLNDELIQMGALCESAIASTVKALITNDKQLAKETIATDSEIDRAEKDIEQLCLKLLLQQQPVAKDLRVISSALKMITDMERIGDQAADIAEILKFTDLSSSEMIDEIKSQAKDVIHMVNASVDAFVKKDLTLAQSVIDYDDRVDDLFDSIREDVIEHIAKGADHAIELVDMLMIAKYLERIGDHATNIAEWVEFSITGYHPDQSDNEE